MFRDTEEALKRLQAQLLEEEETAEQPQEEAEAELLDEETLDAWLDDQQQSQDPRIYQNFSNDYGRGLRNYASGYKAYNSDRSDLDLERYSEAVREPKKPGALRWVAVLLLVLTGAVVGGILWFYLRMRGLL